MNRYDVTREIRALSLPAGEYVVVGGGVLAVRGIRDTEDIDLVVSEPLFSELEAQGWQAKSRPNGKPGLKRGFIEAYLDVNCETFERTTTWLLENAHVLDGVPTIDLETLAEFKAGYGRPKDLQDLALLREPPGVDLPIDPRNAS